MKTLTRFIAASLALAVVALHPQPAHAGVADFVRPAPIILASLSDSLELLPYAALGTYGEGLQQVLIEQNAPHRLMQKISFTATGAVTAFATVTIDDYAIEVRPGSMLAIQCNQDMYYELRKSSAAATAVTAIAGARPGHKLTATQTMYFYKGAGGADPWPTSGYRQGDAAIDIIRDTADGACAVFLVRQ